MIIKVNHRVKDTDIVCEQKWQAMPVLIHSARRGKNSAVIFLSALLVEGSAVSAGRKPPLVDFTGPKHLRMVYLAVAVICWPPLRPPSRTPAAEGQAIQN